MVRDIAILRLPGPLRGSYEPQLRALENPWEQFSAKKSLRVGVKRCVC